MGPLVYRVIITFAAEKLKTDLAHRRSRLEYLNNRYLGLLGRLRLKNEQLADLYGVYGDMRSTEQKEFTRGDPQTNYFDTVRSVKLKYSKKLIQKKFIDLVSQRRAILEELSNRKTEIGFFALNTILKLVRFAYEDLQLGLSTSNIESNYGRLAVLRKVKVMNTLVQNYATASTALSEELNYNSASRILFNATEVKRRALLKYYRTLEVSEIPDTSSVGLVGLRKSILRGVQNLGKRIAYEHRTVEDAMLRHLSLNYEYQKLSAKKYKIFR